MDTIRFRVIPFKGKYAIEVRLSEEPYRGNYIFRYAYDLKEKAEEVCTNLEEGFGKPAGVETDLAANYYRFSQPRFFKLSQRTTQKNNWYIMHTQREQKPV